MRSGSWSVQALQLAYSHLVPPRSSSEHGYIIPALCSIVEGVGDPPQISHRPLCERNDNWPHVHNALLPCAALRLYGEVLPQVGTMNGYCGTWGAIAKMCNPQ